MKIARLSIVAAAGAAIACASKPSPVNVTGTTGDRASLAGKWVGEYSSPATGRTGSIVFNLSPSGDAANGDVVMIPRGYDKALQPYNAAPGIAGAVAGAPGAAPSQVLTIKLVRVAGDTVSGVMDPYRDPECDCAVETTFTGRLNSDTIEGTFSTRGRPSAGPQTGTWRVKRAD
ncbi:MAG TPA: hypothetical protein VGG76_10735 [Gemmatimonadaceae bacterium]